MEIKYILKKPYNVGGHVVTRKFQGKTLYDDKEKLCLTYSEKCDFNFTHEEKPKKEDYTDCYTVEKKSKKNCNKEFEKFDDDKKLCMIETTNKVCELNLGKLNNSEV